MYTYTYIDYILLGSSHYRHIQAGNSYIKNSIHEVSMLCVLAQLCPTSKEKKSSEDSKYLSRQNSGKHYKMKKKIHLIK